MTAKLFEVRDRATTIAAIGIDCTAMAPENTKEEYLLLRHAGYGERCILFGHLQGGALLL